MAYNKQTWRNNELPVIGQTPINAARLNHMEQGILDAHTGNLTTQERNKLAGVEAGATVNSSDADLRNRATHTGIRPMSSVDGLEGALSSKANAADVMTASERTKLTGIEDGATKNVPATDADVAAGTDEVSYITPKQLKTQIDNNPGPQGPEGPQGPAGTGVTILGSFDSPSELPPTGDNGDAYLVQGDLYVWAGTEWDNVGTIQGPEGSPGDDGVGINRIDVSYVVSSASVTTAPTSGWVTTLPTVPKGQKLWTRMVSVLTNGNQTTAYTSAVQGADGAPGSAGVGVSNITKAYNISAGGVTPPESGWQPLPVAPTNDRPYMWTRNTLSLTNGNTSNSFSCARSGTDGAPGQPGTNGVGISTATTAYQLSASGTTAPTGTWSSTPLVQTSALPFLWARTTTRYTDSSETLSYSVSRRGEDAPEVGNATTTVAGLVALADAVDVVAGTPGKAVTTDVLKSTLDALPVGEGEGNTISVAFTGSWPAERPTQSADAVVLCLDPTGTAEPPAWFIEGKDTFAGPTSATAQIYELAVRDGWTAMFDPAMATIVDGEIVIPDLLGNLADPFKGQSGQGVINENGYGALASLTGTSVSRLINGVHDGVTPLHMMVATEFIPGPVEQAFFNGGFDTNINPDITTYQRVHVPGGSANLWVGRSGADGTVRGKEITPGKHIFDVTWEGSDELFRVDGQYIQRLYTRVAARTYNLRIGRNARAGQESTLWQGGIGVILMRRDRDEVAIRRMRDLLIELGHIEREKPRFMPAPRICVLDRQGVVRIAKGDVDSVPDASFLSLTKGWNLLTLLLIMGITPDRQNEDLLDSTTVTIEAGDFLWGVPSGTPAGRFRVGDVVTLRELAYAAAVPSDNDAPLALARFGGAMLPGTDDPKARFVGRMMELADSWGWTRHRVEVPGGGGFASARDAADLMFRIADHPVAREIYGAWEHDIVVQGGPAPRQWSEVKGLSWTPGLRSEILVSKTGGDGVEISHVAGVWRDPSTGEEFAIAVMGINRQDPGWRYQSPVVEATSRTDDWQSALEALRTGCAWINSSENYRSGAVTRRTGKYDVTSLFTGAVRGTATFGEPGIFLEVVGEHVHLSFYRVEVPGITFISSEFIKDGLRPQNDEPGFLMRGDKAFPVLVRASGSVVVDGGDVNYPPEPTTGRKYIHGKLIWPRRAYRASYPRLPGVPFETYVRTSSEEGGD